MEQTGYTLFELAIVLVVLGIVVAVAIFSFYDGSSEARTASVASVAAALNAASYGNYRQSKAGSAISIDNCNDFGALLPHGGLPSGYQIISQSISVGAFVTCTVKNTLSNDSATFTGIGVT